MKRNIYVPLKLAIFKKHMTQNELALKTNIHYSRISQLTHGAMPSSDERIRLSKALNTPQKELWGEIII